MTRLTAISVLLIVIIIAGLVTLVYVAIADFPASPDNHPSDQSTTHQGETTASSDEESGQTSNDDVAPVLPEETIALLRSHVYASRPIDPIIKELILYETPYEVTDSDLKALSYITTLTSLEINSRKVTGAGLQYLSNLKSLRKLRLLGVGGTNVADEDLAVFTCLKSLTELDLFSNAMSGTILSQLKTLPALNHLTLCSSVLEDQALTLLKDFPQLSHLSLRGRGRNINDDTLKCLADISKLQRLDLNCTKVEGHGLAHLKTLPQLSTLSLERSSITDDGLAAIRELKALQHLILTGTYISNAGITQLKESNLQTIDLRNTALDDSVFGVLIDMPTLHEIKITTSKGASRKGVEYLKFIRARPDCKVLLEGMHPGEDE